MSETNAERFLNAFSEIEDKLAQQQRRREKHDDWVPFSDLLAGSDTLLQRQKDLLRQYAKLRNAIAHSKRVGGKPIADPREDAVVSIEKIRDNLLRPPRLVDALDGYGRPQVFEPEDGIGEFLALVVEKSFSQAPVRTDDGYRLITTNAVARYLAPSLIEHEIVGTATIGEVLDFAETGDRLETLAPSATVLEAINLFSGEASTRVEPPAALLVLDATKEHLPQVLCSRADLSQLYAQLEV